MSDFQRQINKRVEAFVTDITELARQHAIDTLSRALEERGLGKNGVSTRSRSRGGKRSPAQVERDSARLLAFVQSNPGQRAEEIGSALGMTTKEMALPMRKLVSAKKIKTEGQKRATRYSPARAAPRNSRSAGKRRRRK